MITSVTEVIEVIGYQLGGGALEVLKADCELRPGRTPGPSDVAEERMRLCLRSVGP